LRQVPFHGDVILTGQRGPSFAATKIFLVVASTTNTFSQPGSCGHPRLPEVTRTSLSQWSGERFRFSEWLPIRLAARSSRDGDRDAGRRVHQTGLERCGTRTMSAHRRVDDPARWPLQRLKGPLARPKGHKRSKGRLGRRGAFKGFRAAVCASTRNPGSGGGDTDGLVVLTRGGGGQQGRTFADKRIALHLAAWISSEFEVWMHIRETISWT
jgi:hypothetical protein